MSRTHILEGIKELHDEIARLTATIKKYEITMAEMKRRLDYYENPHSPPSQNSIPTKQRKAQGPN